ncbi:hypothetical protein [Actomonas aquatica]|uniref:Uncharacterized protein n=1 Tax=Actomonas aquatica TaxID=2866162 RepID=A0ABZ1CE63_9BACT|nr:hypothetical protein [Opitutus sp. WL0086]WRQ88575.1 hypothetical protein K1X11_004110 [Opitutus sp. WL0086]
MSLINEALKKAQKQRADEAAAQSGAVPPPGSGLGGAKTPGSPPPPSKPPRAPASGSDFEGDDDGRGARRSDPLVAARSRRAGGGLSRWAMPVGVGAVILIGGVWWFGRGDSAGAGDGDGDAGEPARVGAVASASREADVAGAANATDAANAAGQVSEPAATAVATAVVVTPVEVEEDEEGRAVVDETAVPVVAATGVAADEANEGMSGINVREADKRLDQQQSGQGSLAVREVVHLVDPSEGAGERQEMSGMKPDPQGYAREEPVVTVPARASGGGLTILTDAEATRSTAAVVNAGGAARPNEAVLRYLERSRVTGVRVSATDPKVLMNDRVYRLEDVVDRDLQLRVIAITDRELQFRDPQGFVYTKRF